MMRFFERAWRGSILAALLALAFPWTAAHADGFPSRPTFGTVTFSSSGTAAAPSIFGASSVVNAVTTGIYWPSSANGELAFSSRGIGIAKIWAGGFQIEGSLNFGALSGGGDVFLQRKAAASLQLGAADAASPVAQTLGPQSVSTGTNNTAGQVFTIRDSAGTGTGASGGIVFKTAPAGGGTFSPNAYVTALTINSTGGITIGAPTGGDKGAGTLNAQSGLYVAGEAIGPTYGSGSYTVATGCTTTPSAGYTAYVIGKVATVTLTAHTPCTSNATTATITGIPAWLQPATVTSYGLTTQQVDSGTTQTTPGLVKINAASGTWDVYKNTAAGAWTASGNKMTGALTVTYTLQ